jgi:hypothetical protein
MSEVDQFTFSGNHLNGKMAWLIQWGLFTFCFCLVSLRKNICLIIVLGLLASGNVGVKKLAGAVGFLTAVAAWYTAMAEIVNEEWGRHLLPGLRPRIMPECIAISKDVIVKHAEYDPKNKTMFLQFHGMQIKTLPDVLAIKEGVEEAIKGTGKLQVHAVVDYEDVVLLDGIASDYWNMVNELQREHYLLAKRFHISSFGTKGPMLQQAVGLQLNNSFLDFLKGKQAKDPSGRV